MTLSGVCYTFRVDDPAAEPPYLFPVVWLYARFHGKSGDDRTHELGLKVFSLDDTGRKKRVEYPMGFGSAEPWDLGTLRFPAHSPAGSVAFRLPEVVLPRRGRVEFRVLRRGAVNWKGSSWRSLGSHYITVE